MAIVAGDAVRFALAQRFSGIGTEVHDPRPVNLRVLAETVDVAAEHHAEVVVFGEMFLTGLRTDGWLPKWPVCPDDDTDPTLRAIADLSARRGITIIAGSATTDAAGTCRNSVVIVDASGTWRVYHKRHLARIRLADGYEADESQFYQRGDGPAVFPMTWGRLGLQICYEVTFPEVARCAMLGGADVILNCTASIAGAEEIWAAMARSRAFENGAFFLVCSVVGQQGEDRYFGGSAAYDPHGQLIAQGASGSEDLILVDVPIGLSQLTRAEMNILGARRPNLYSALVETSTVEPVA